MMNEKLANNSLEPGDHGTTYGGNPLVLAMVDKVLEIIERDDIAAHVREVGDYLYKKLDELSEKYDCIKAHRGMGLIQGIECTVPVGDIVNRSLERGLVLISASNNVVRFVPPLIIENEHVDEMIQLLGEVLDTF